MVNVVLAKRILIVSFLPWSIRWQKYNFLVKSEEGRVKKMLPLFVFLSIRHKTMQNIPEFWRDKPLVVILRQQSCNKCLKET